MKDVQQIGGPFDEQSVFVGLPRQLAVDTTNWRILLHDGETPGGHLFINRNESDDRYQQRSSELDGIVELDPLAFGFVVRQAPGVYTVRSLNFNSSTFIVTNSAGRAGNPNISLKPVQTDDYTFEGVIHFSGTVTSSVAWEGSTQGTHTGDTNGTHTGNVIGDVTGDTTGNHTGGIDIRGAETFFDADQIPVEAVNGLAAALAAIPGALPTGSILMWHGDSSNIPAGFFLCDGDNGTPDLQDRFIIGAGTIDPHTTGGSDVATTGGTIEVNGVHSHDVTVADHQLIIAELPTHFHGSGVCDTASGNAFNHGTIAAAPAAHDNIETNSGSAGGYESKTTSTGGDQPHGHGAESGDSGSHSHVFTGASIDILPPFYALCYIMKG